jgi:hypothetical protein
MDAISNAVAANYRLAERIPYSAYKEFRTIAGFQTQPELLLVQKDTRP